MTHISRNHGLRGDLIYCQRSATRRMAAYHVSTRSLYLLLLLPKMMSQRHRISRAVCQLVMLQTENNSEILT